MRITGFGKEGGIEFPLRGGFEIKDVKEVIKHRLGKPKVVCIVAPDDLFVSYCPINDVYHVTPRSVREPR